MPASRRATNAPGAVYAFRAAGSLGVVLVVSFTSACTSLLHRHARPVADTSGTANVGPIAQGGAPGIAPGERLGTVSVIGTGRRFVLVQTASGQSISTLVDGQTLLCRAPGGVTATLRVSHERRPPFVVADVATGEPHVGDEVFIDTAPARTTAAALAAAPPASPTPAAAPEFRTDPALPPTR